MCADSTGIGCVMHGHSGVVLGLLMPTDSCEGIWPGPEQDVLLIHGFLGSPWRILMISRWVLYHAELVVVLEGFECSLLPVNALQSYVRECSAKAGCTDLAIMLRHGYGRGSLLGNHTVQLGCLWDCSFCWVLMRSCSSGSIIVMMLRMQILSALPYDPT